MAVTTFHHKHVYNTIAAHGIDKIDFDFVTTFVTNAIYHANTKFKTRVVALPAQ